MNKLKARGDFFLKAVRQKHMLYVGPTYTVHPNGSALQNVNEVLDNSLVNSEVILDFLQSEKLGLDLTYGVSMLWMEGKVCCFTTSDDFEEEYPLILRNGRGDKEHWSDEEEIIANDSSLETRRRRKWAAEDPFL